MYNKACIDSISTQSCFQETYQGSPDKWRRIWMTEIEEVAFEKWNSGLSMSEWKKGWSILKESGNYEYQLGDLVLPGIAHCTKKDVVIFNTSSRANCPVYVVQASSLCKQSSNTEIPIILAYNQSHYEMLLPVTNKDLEKTIQLKKDVINGNYIFQY